MNLIVLWSWRPGSHSRSRSNLFCVNAYASILKTWTGVFILPIVFVLWEVNVRLIITSCCIVKTLFMRQASPLRAISSDTNQGKWDAAEIVEFRIEPETCLVGVSYLPLNCSVCLLLKYRSPLCACAVLPNRTPRIKFVPQSIENFKYKQEHMASITGSGLSSRDSREWLRDHLKVILKVFTLFSYIHALLIDKVLYECRNVSIKILCTLLFVSFIQCEFPLFILFGRNK